MKLEYLTPGERVPSQLHVLSYKPHLEQGEIGVEFWQCAVTNLPANPAVWTIAGISFGKKLTLKGSSRIPPLVVTLMKSAPCLRA